MPYIIVTNNHKREILDAWQLPSEVRESPDFDYIDWAACDRGEDSVSFVKAYGEWHDLHDVDGPCTGGLKDLGWHTYKSVAYYFGYVFRSVEDEYTHEWSVVVGKYMAED